VSFSDIWRTAASAGIIKVWILKVRVREIHEVVVDSEDDDGEEEEEDT